MLLDRADRLLTAAAGEDDPRERFLAAYLSALRGAAAVLAATESGRSGRERSRSAWVRLAKAAPEFVMWSDYFSGYSETRAALEAGISRPVSAEAADEFYARVGAFLHDVDDLVADGARLRTLDRWGSDLTA
ncbi:hypothetical protein KV203_06995 [Skermania piniformis]|uniref:SAV-6107-like HEPN domain-containing protein n=2 Tax=Skermania pinensis TaxID=39122 RepID=A0ABX8SH09_9ACTN|nr:hypothetical protein KV203_06995 [Skermania piniformis]